MGQLLGQLENLGEQHAGACWGRTPAGRLDVDLDLGPGGGDDPHEGPQRRISGWRSRPSPDVIGSDNTCAAGCDLLCCADPADGAGERS